MKSATIYGIQVFVAAFVVGAAFDYLFRDGINWYATGGFAAFLGAVLGLIHAMGWMPKRT